MSSQRRRYLVALGGAALLVAVSLAAYDRWILRPALAIGAVDLSEIYRAKEAQFAQLLVATGSEEEREQALQMARAFSQRLPVALDELPLECGCLVVLKTAVIGGPRVLNLTPALRQKVGLP
jgi:hypothetical protein